MSLITCKNRRGGGIWFKVRSCEFLSGGRVSSRAVGGWSSSWRLRSLFAFILSVALLFGVSDAWAADWTVSESTTLTEDTTVDALTVEEGITLDLNGYSLTCTSLAGSGTITSTLTDLTMPSGTVTSSPDTLYNDTTPQMLFDNDTGTRALLQKVNLPFAVTYDFGVGAEKTINKYKIYGPSSNATRGPKVWTLDGSTDGDVWTLLDTQIGVTWSNGQNKEFSFSNTSAYRYYRVTITDSSDINTKWEGPFLELNEIEYFGPGELHVNVPAGAEATVGSLTISGNMKVVKDGEGRLSGVTGIGSSTFPGVLEVNAGTVYVDADFILGTAADGTLTINGGTVEVNSSKATHIGENSGKTGTVNLNGGILKTKRLVNLTGATGMVNFDGGTLQANNTDNNGLFGNKVTVTVNAGGGTIDSGNFAVKVPAPISGTGAIRFKGGNTITHNAASTYTGGTTIELGTKIITSNEIAKNTILANLVIDGKTKTADENGIVVFEYSGLADEDVPTPDYKNCGLGTTIYRDGDTLKVDFVLPVWELAADTTWSELVEAYGAPAADVIVHIASSGEHTLTIDTDVAVKELVFNDDASATLTVAEGKTLTTENINGIGKIINNGTIVKTGTETVEWPFDNASSGLYVVSAGRINVSKRTGYAYVGSSQVIRVKNGATFDFHAIEGKGLNFSVVLEDGARFANSKDDLHTASQATGLTLEGNATVVPFYNFGLIARGHGVTTLNLGTYTLTVDSASSFILDNTTISGTGTIFVKKGTLYAIENDSVGSDCTFSIASEGGLNLGKNLTVKNFVNNGKISGSATLTVLGELSPGNPVPKLTLADGATIKASATQSQTVSTTFRGSGTITIDASEITKDQLKVAGVTGIPVLTVPVVPSDVNWNMTGLNVDRVRAKWRVNEDGTKTLYIARSDAFRVIIR